MNEHQVIVKKFDGTKEVFDKSKLYQSLLRSGAQKSIAEAVADQVEGEIRDGMTTGEIYHHAFKLLHREAKPIAARYSLRRAVAELGPSGFPFEKFLAAILVAHGYRTTTDVILKGACVDHEIDVIAWNEKKAIAIEAKFHNEPGIKSDLKIALYIKSRFEDIKDSKFLADGKPRNIDEGWLMTNTKFTQSAIQYGECKGLTMIGWNYPTHGNLNDMIESKNLHPITALNSLSGSEKRSLLEAGIVLCSQLTEEILASAGIDSFHSGSVLEEADSVRKIKYRNNG